MKLINLLLIAFLASSLFANEDKYIKDTLLKYNYGIIKMGLSGETQFFKEFVKEDVAIKLQVWFESWKFSNLTYIAKINDVRFSPIYYNEHNATIKTLENWTFSYVNLATKRLALKPMHMFYEMQYTLAKKDDKWMIVEIKHLREKHVTDPNIHKPSLEKNQPANDTDSGNTQGNIATH